MKFLRILALLVTIWTLSFGVGFGVGQLARLCPASHHYHGLEVVGEVNLPGVELWKVEIGRRFPDAVVFFSHGASVGHKWVCQNPLNPSSIQDALYVHDVAVSLRDMYPGRVIVLIVCNPEHLSVGVPGVYYAKENILMYPDRSLDMNNFVGRTLEPDAVGNIYEFTEDK